MALTTQTSRLQHWRRLGRTRNRLLVLGIAGIVPLICVALTGFYTMSRLTEKTRAIVLATTSLRNHWEGDMMHDDLRGDVYAALVANNERERTAAQASLAGNAKRFRDALARNRKLPALDPKIRRL